MRTSYLISLAVATALFTGCGGSSSGSDIVGSATTLTVERGPILKAVVVDANGQKADDNGNGKYTFASAPLYPVMATGGIIDMDRDGVVSQGDVVSDLNLTTTSGSVITVATTLASNPVTKAELDKMAADLNLTTADILNKTPSESKEIEAISNVAYKFIKDNNITDLLDTQDQKLVDLNISANVVREYAVYVSDDTHDFEQNERDLMDSIISTNPEAVNHLDNDAEVEQELSRVETEFQDADVEAIKNDLLVLKNEYEVEYGDLNYEDEGSDFNHNQGIACATCHSSSSTAFAPSRSEAYESEDSENEGSESEGSESEGSEGGENSFTSGATIFTTLNASNNDASKAANNYTLRLLLESGATEGYRIGRGTGNVNGTFNAGIANYTAQVLDAQGNVVNTSATNSHNASRFDCNSCHTSAGTSGAPGRIVSFKYAPVITLPETNTTTPDTNTTVPADTNTTTPDTNTTVPADTNTTTPVVLKSFANDVEPILNAKCKSCHGGSGNFSITTSTTPYAGVTPFVNTTSATTSALLQKGSGSVGHGGGDQLGGTTSTSYITIRDWISEGALNN